MLRKTQLKVILHEYKNTLRIINQHDEDRGRIETRYERRNEKKKLHKKKNTERACISVRSVNNVYMLQ